MKLLIRLQMTDKLWNELVNFDIESYSTKVIYKNNTFLVSGNSHISEGARDGVSA